jgi:glutaredoxin
MSFKGALPYIFTRKIANASADSEVVGQTAKFVLLNTHRLHYGLLPLLKHPLTSMSIVFWRKGRAPFIISLSRFRLNRFRGVGRSHRHFHFIGERSMKTNATFYHAGCPVCVDAERQIADALDSDRYDVELVHLGEQKDRIADAEAAGVKSVPALVINGAPFHINFGAPMSALKS